MHVIDEDAKMMWPSPSESEADRLRSIYRDREVVRTTYQRRSPVAVGESSAWQPVWCRIERPVQVDAGSGIVVEWADDDKGIANPHRAVLFVPLSATESDWNVVWRNGYPELQQVPE